MTEDIDLSKGSTITTSSLQSNAGSVDIYAGGEVRVNNSIVSIRGGQGVVDGVLKSNKRFAMNNPIEAELETFLNKLDPPELKMTAVGDVVILADSVINAESGLLSGSVTIESTNGSVIIEDSTVTLASEQLGMNLANVWDAWIDKDTGTLDAEAFRDEYESLFPDVTLTAGSRIELERSSLITDAGLDAQQLDEANAASVLTTDAGPAVLQLTATSEPSRLVRGFGGLINLGTENLQPPQMISLLDSTLQAESYKMGGNISVAGNDYVVNNSNIIAKAQAVGGDYTINAESWLQSLDSTIDLSGAQDGQIETNASLVDLGTALAKLSSDFLQSIGFSGESCALYYAKKQSSFIVAPPKVNSTNVDDYLPSILPAALFEMDFDAISVDESEWDVQEFP